MIQDRKAMFHARGIIVGFRLLPVAFEREDGVVIYAIFLAYFFGQGQTKSGWQLLHALFSRQIMTPPTISRAPIQKEIVTDS